MTSHSRQDLRGKKVLITHTLVQGFMGSTVVALELAAYLKEHGARVTLYAAFIAEPMRSEFASRGITLIGEREAEALRLEHLDFVWVQSQVLPLSLIRQLGQTLPDRLPMFVFNHMSALDYAPDEFPYLYGLEERLSSLSVCVSEEARQKVSGFFTKGFAPISLYRNPAPREFCELTYTPNAELRRVLIVSNHGPREVAEAGELLTARGLSVSTLGDHHDSAALVTADLLSQFDVVVTIGKTVQYCLVSGIPVFVYDHFGGFGYLDAENVMIAAATNFSGRGGAKLTGEEIADEVVRGFAAGAAFQQARRDQFIAEYANSRVIPQVLSQARPRTVERLEPHRMEAALAAQRFGSRYYRAWGAEVLRIEEVRRAQAAQHEAQKEQRSALRGLDAARAALEQARQEERRVKSSLSYRVGVLLMLPAIKARQLVCRVLSRRWR